MIRIDEALARAKANGKVILKKDLAALLWPNAVEVAQQVNMTRLCSGKTAAVKPEWLRTICDVTGVSADFLIGRANE